MHAASLDKSPRLQRVLAVLKELRPSGTARGTSMLMGAGVRREFVHFGAEAQRRGRAVPATGRPGRAYFFVPALEVDNDGKPD